jgi:hypothetical protein
MLLVMCFEEAELLRLRAEAYLQNAERLHAECEYDLAAFRTTLPPYAEIQASPQNRRPPPHAPLIRLVRKLTKDAERVKRLLKDIVMLTKIEDATRLQMPPTEIRKGGS